MAKTNYNKMSEKTTKPVEAAEEITEVTEAETTEEVATEPVVETKAPAAPKVIYGVVDNCDKLNVRFEPNVKSEVACVIAKGTKVVVEKSGSTKDFYKVHSVDDGNATEGFNGFCMKKYISIVK